MAERKMILAMEKVELIVNMGERKQSMDIFLFVTKIIFFSLKFTSMYLVNFFMRHKRLLH